MRERRETGFGKIIDDAIFRITRGPAYYQANLVLIQEVVIARFGHVKFFGVKFAERTIENLSGASGGAAKPETGAEDTEDVSSGAFQESEEGVGGGSTTENRFEDGPVSEQTPEGNRFKTVPQTPIATVGIVSAMKGFVPLLDEAGVNDLGEDGVHFAFQDISDDAGLDGVPNFLACDLTDLLIK